MVEWLKMVEWFEMAEWFSLLTSTRHVGKPFNHFNHSAIYLFKYQWEKIRSGCPFSGVPDVPGRFGNSSLPRSEIRFFAPAFGETGWVVILVFGAGKIPGTLIMFRFLPLKISNGKTDNDLIYFQTYCSSPEFAA